MKWVAGLCLEGLCPVMPHVFFAISCSLGFLTTTKRTSSVMCSRHHDVLPHLRPGVYEVQKYRLKLGATFIPSSPKTLSLNI